LVSPTKGRTKSDRIREEGAEEDILALKAGINSRLEKTAQ